MGAIATRKMKFLSRPVGRRAGLVPMSIAIALAWSFTMVAFLISIAYVRQFAIWGSLSLLVVFAFSIYMTFVTYAWVNENRRRNELLVDGDNFSLSSYDQQKMTRINQQISLRDVREAEYYEPRDSTSLLLRGRAMCLEIPLWAFGPNAERKIVGLVRSAGVKVIGIPDEITVDQDLRS